MNFSGVQSLRRLLLPAAPALPPDARGLGAAGHPLVLSLPLAESVWVSGAPRQPGLRAARPGRHARGRGTGRRRSPRPGRRQLVPTGPSGEEVPAGGPAPHGRMWGRGWGERRKIKEQKGRGGGGGGTVARSSRRRRRRLLGARLPALTGSYEAGEGEPAPAVASTPPSMVRETRHLWVGNLPENVREEKIIEHFKR